MDLMKFETEQMMTLKEITDLLEVRHNDAMNVVLRMSEDKEFGMITKVSYSYEMPNGGVRGMDTYQLNKRQSIAVAARLNTSLLMRIIDRWQELENQSRPTLTSAEIILASAQRLVEIEREQARTEARLKEMGESLDRVHAKQSAFEEGFSYFTVLAYASYKGITIDLSAAQRMGRKASLLSKKKQLPIDRVKDPRFGYINSYHESVLDEIISESL